MVIMIVLITAIAKTARHRHHTVGDSSIAPHEVTRAQDEIRALKERVQVLERVITDNHNSLDLDREIERLRDR